MRTPIRTPYSDWTDPYRSKDNTDSVLLQNFSPKCDMCRSDSYLAVFAHGNQPAIYNDRWQIIGREVDLATWTRLHCFCWNTIKNKNIQHSFNDCSCWKAYVMTVHRWPISQYEAADHGAWSIWPAFSEVRSLRSLHASAFPVKLLKENRQLRIKRMTMVQHQKVAYRRCILEASTTAIASCSYHPSFFLVYL